MITYEHWNLEGQKQPVLLEDTPSKGALETLEWAYEAYGEKLVYACSFGIEGIVLIDLISNIKPDAEIVFLDTGYHFKETYEVIEKVQRRYPDLQIKLHTSELTLEEQANQYGKDLWQSNPNLCCNLRKIVPLTKALEPAVAWISGLRREQSETRRHTQFINQDHKFKKVKVCPLIHWTWKDVWRYVSKHELDYNILHDQGYPSIGCETCTKPAFSADDFRSGRWSGSGKTECGLHAD